MSRTQNAYIEISLGDDDIEEATGNTIIDAPFEGTAWFDEKTTRIDFDAPALSADAKLVLGYLTMEENGMFAELSIEEQQQIAKTLKR